MSLYAPESTLSLSSAPWNLEERHGTDSCYECDDVYPIREMHAREDRKIGSYRLCPACVPRCVREDCGLLSSGGYEECIDHALETASQWLAELSDDELSSSRSRREAEKDIDILNARQILRAAATKREVR